MTASAATRPPPLDGIRVLDLSRVLAGPFCTMTLSDLGADVIKIENPKGGDDTRTWGPFVQGESTYYLSCNRGKRSVAVDLASSEGQRTIRELALHCDVVVENFRAGALERYGLDHQSLRALKPALVYCSISGYGRASPLADRAGYDFAIQAETGLMSATGEPGGAPMKAGVAVSDLFTGMAAVQAILAALIARDRDGGIGQWIDMALYDTQLAALANLASARLVTGTEPARFGNAHASIVPYQVFRAADADLVIAVGNDRQYRLLCEQVLDRPEWSADPRFATNRQRIDERPVLVPMLAARFAEQPAAYWLPKLEAAGIPHGRVRSIGEALAAPETLARGMVQAVDHPVLGRMPMVASPLHLQGTPVRAPSAPPMLGQHTAEVLRALLGRGAG